MWLVPMINGGWGGGIPVFSRVMVLVLTSFFPVRRPDGENFNDFISSVDPNTPHVIGNLASFAVVKSLELDASNQLGIPSPNITT